METEKDTLIMKMTELLHERNQLLSEDVRKPLEESFNKIMERTKRYLTTGAGYYWQKITSFQLNEGGKNWKVVDFYDTGGYGNYEACDLCGFPKCRYKFVIVSEQNFLARAMLGTPLKDIWWGGKKLGTKYIDGIDANPDEVKSIGDECVLNYLDENGQEIFKRFKRTAIVKVFNIKKYEPLAKEMFIYKEAMRFKMTFRQRYEVSSLTYKIINGGELTTETLKNLPRILGLQQEVSI